MGCFIGEFAITPTGRRMARVHESFQFTCCTLGKIITIPARFQTDGATVPWFIWLLIPPWGEYGPAAVVHDYLYRWQHCTRREADRALVEGLIACKADGWLLVLIYTFVRLLGWHGWKKDSGRPLSAEELTPNLNPPPCPRECDSAQ